MLQQIVDNIQTRPIYLIGSPGAGKTELSKILCDELIKRGVTVRCFDASLAWYHNCPLPNRFAVEYPDEVHVTDNTLFDLGRLRREERQQVITDMVKMIHDARYMMKLREPDFMDKTGLDVTFIEEEQNMFKKYGVLEDLHDWAAMGRNFRMSAVHTTQRPAEVRTDILERCDILVGYTTHENNLKKLKQATDPEFMKKLGRIKSRSYEFLYYNGETFGPFTFTPRRYPVPKDVPSVWSI